MPVIKHRHNYALIKLTKLGPIQDTKRIIHDHIWCQRKEEHKPLRFGGFTRPARLNQFENVVFTHIEEITHDPDGWRNWIDIRYPCAGVYYEGLVFLVLDKEGLPLRVKQ